MVMNVKIIITETVDSIIHPCHSTIICPGSSIKKIETYPTKQSAINVKNNLINF